MHTTLKTSYTCIKERIRR